MSLERSPAQIACARLVHALGKARAHEALEMILARLSTVELAALRYDWRETWARPKQIAPSGGWRWWGWLAGRGSGKTTSVVHHVQEKVAAGRARRVLLIAQDEDNAIALQVHGDNGLVTTAPPWFRPHWVSSQNTLEWPNGAIAVVRTPEVPGKIRGLEYDLAWATEIQSWPASTRNEAWMNVQISTRIGDAQIVWDATPKKAHPILLELVADAARDPERYRLVRGSTHENAANLARGYLEELEGRFGGTQRGKEEIYGEMLDESENALVQQVWIDKARRPAPEAFVRSAIAIDPAVSTRRSSDRTGIIQGGVGPDGQAYVLADLSGRHPAHEWAELVLKRYVEDRVDLVVLERNKGGDLVAGNLRAAASSRGLSVVILGPTERPRHTRGVVYVREVHSQGPKLDRAQPMATAYERGRVSHVVGVDLSSLESTLTTWEPMDRGDDGSRREAARSPDDLDAAAILMTELLDLKIELGNPRTAFAGLSDVAAVLARTGRPGRI